jgi:hypothetical protein
MPAVYQVHTTSPRQQGDVDVAMTIEETSAELGVLF